MAHLDKRAFLAATALGLTTMGLGAGLAPAFAQHEGGMKGPRRDRTARTTKLFKAPGLYPNGLATAPEGIWIAQQTMKSGKDYAPGATEAVWLTDWNGKLLKTATHPAANTSGLAYGNGHVYALGNDGAHEGADILEPGGKLVMHRPMPLGGGGSHGGQWHQDKLWLVVNRINAMVRVDPATWNAEFAIPIFFSTPQTKRWHDMTFDNEGFIWMVTGNDSTGPDSGRPGLAKYDPQSGALLELVPFAPGSSDPHGLVFHDGKLVSCDAGYHPGWKDQASPTSGWLFAIDIA